MIRRYLSDITNEHKSQGEWKTQLAMSINFISSKGSDETCTMHTKSDDIKLMIGKETDEIIKNLLDSHLQKYKKDLQEKMRGSEFVFDSGPNIDYPKWLNKKTTKNTKK